MGLADKQRQRAEEFLNEWCNSDTEADEVKRIYSELTQFFDSKAIGATVRRGFSGKEAHRLLVLTLKLLVHLNDSLTPEDQKEIDDEIAKLK